MAKIKLVDLFEGMQSALIAIGTSKQSLQDYRYSGFCPLQRYFEKRGCAYYSQKLVDEFVAESLDAYKNNRMSKPRHQRIRKVAAMLAEYKNTGAIKWAYLPKINAKPFTCKHFETLFSRYLLDSSEKNSRKMMEGIRCVVKPFLFYLEENGHRRISCLNRKIVSAYIPLIAKRQPGNMSNVIWHLKLFLRYLHENNYIVSELASALPGYPTKCKKHRVGFTREESQALICSTPSSANLGKRNVAMFTLAESVGLRAVDVANLKLRDIDWRNKTISIIQSKTKNSLVLPLENHVGDVLAEYILHGRPESDSPFVFLTVKRPFHSLTGGVVSATTTRYMKKSGIENNPSLRKGFHCFRRSVGTWLLEAELPLAMISEILGHAHIDSTKPYLSTDLERLRECAIGLDGIEIQNGIFK